MADWPIGSGSWVESAGNNPSTSSGTAIISAVGSNTKGSWVQLIASTGFAAHTLIVLFNPPGASNLLDIGIGGSGSEQILIPDILCSVVSGQIPMVCSWPVHIPAGSRISARLANSSGNTGGTLVVYPVGGGFDAPSPRSCVKAYGINSGTTRGTSVDPGGSANTKGSWTQIASSTSASMRGLIIATTQQANAAGQVASSLADIGVGGAGSEQVLIPNYRVLATDIEQCNPPISPVFPVSISQGSRLAIRTQCGITDATDRLLDWALYGIT